MRYFFDYVISEFGLLGSKLVESNVSTQNYLIFFALSLVFIALCGYLLGSINPAILISKKFYGYDIRDYGSGNAGMTNMFRTFGKKAGFLTLLGDVAKALVAVVIGFALLGNKGQYVAGFFCLLGHSFPVYFKFKGGKGVIVSAITILLIDPLVFLALVVIFGLMFAATQIISASSITAAFFYPVVVYAFNVQSPDLIFILFSLFIACFVIAMHKENIHRLLNKTEKKFTIGNKNSK